MDFAFAMAKVFLLILLRQRTILNWLLINTLRRRSCCMDFAFAMAKVFLLILFGQHSIVDWPLIRIWLRLSYGMGFVFGMAKVLMSISLGRPIFLDWPLAKGIVWLRPTMAFPWSSESEWVGTPSVQSTFTREQPRREVVLG
jgi:hypothetical protein